MFKDLQIKNEKGELEKAFPKHYNGTRENPTKEIWNKLNHIERIDWLREEIKSINIQELEEEILRYTDLQYSVIILLEHVKQYLSEARFWLGFELQRIKEQIL